MENASLPPPVADSTAPLASSLGSRLINVFAAPGDAFGEIKGRPPSLVNWLVPVLLSAVFGVVYCLVVFSQETVMHQIRETQARALEKKLEKMPPEQREKVREMAEQFTTPTLMKAFGSAGAVVGSFAWLFFLALVMWLLGTRLFKAQFGYTKALEVCGLAGVIPVLGSIIAMLLVVITGNMFATPGPVLLIREYDPASKTHLLLSAANLMTFWYIGVLAVGLAKLSHVSFAKAVLWLVVPWLVFRAGLILSGLGQGI